MTTNRKIHFLTEKNEIIDLNKYDTFKISINNYYENYTDCSIPKRIVTYEVIGCNDGFPITLGEFETEDLAKQYLFNIWKYLSSLNNGKFL